MSDHDDIDLSLLTDRERDVLELAIKRGALKFYAHDVYEIARLLVDLRSERDALHHRVRELESDRDAWMVK